MDYSSANINIMVNAAKKASRKLVRDFSEMEYLQVSKKTPANFMSIARSNSEKILREELTKSRSNIPIYLASSHETMKENEQYRFIINPLDDCDNFLHAIPYFAISISLERKSSKGIIDIVATVIEAPALGETYWAEKGSGAWMEKNTEAMRNRLRLRVSNKNSLNEAGFTIKLNKDLDTNSASIFNGSWSVRIIGNSMLNYAYLASGRFDLLAEIGNSNPNQSEGGHLLLLEAGGKIYQDLTLPFNSTLLCDNGLIYNELKKLLKKN